MLSSLDALKNKSIVNGSKVG